MLNKKILSMLLCGTLATVTTTTVFAGTLTQIQSNKTSIIQTIKAKPAATDADILKALKELPYTDAERKEILQGIHETRDEVNAIKNSRGKLSWAVKALRVAWDKIPTKVKTAIGGYVGFEKMMDVIENYTGAIEDGIYKGALEVTGNSTAAWWISKTLMLFL